MFKWLLVALLPAIFAARALLAPGFIPTHDGEYHLIRFHEFETMLKSGSLFPRWAPNLNSGYGVPLFNFHYPFPNYFGSLFHFLGASLADSVKLVLVTGYLTAVAFCFLWLSALFKRRVAAIGTIVFSLVPYWFVDLYVRGVVGEVLALAWVMLAFACIERGWKVGVAVSIGLLIASHNIMAILFLPILFLYLIARRRSAIVAFFVGIGLASYFWIPALLERDYVVGLNSVNFRDHFPALTQTLFPSWGTGFSQPGQNADEMSFQIGVVPLMVLFASLILFLKHMKNVLALFFLFICGVGFLLMQETSLWIWEFLSFLQYVQYPWRLLSVFLPGAAYLTGYLVMKKGLFVGATLVLVAVVVTVPYIRPVTYEPRSDVYYLSRPNFTDGTSSLGNTFSTRWSQWKGKRPRNKVEVVNGEARATILTTSSIRYKFLLQAKSESRIRVNTLYYPGWKVWVDGELVPIDYQNDGTITFPITVGENKVTVSFAETPLRKAADVLSLASLLWLIFSVILDINARRHRHLPTFKQPQGSWYRILYKKFN